MATVSILLNRSAYSNDEYTSVDVVSPDALFITVDGLSLNSLGSITPAGNGVFTLGAGALKPIAAFTQSDGVTVIPEFTCSVTTVEVSDPSNLGVVQLLTFPVTVTQTGNVGGMLPTPAGFAPMLAKASVGADQAPNAPMQFIQASSPFMRYGQTSWLSIDTYVFKVRDNGSGAPTGLPNMNAAQTPTQYLQSVLSGLTSPGFDNLPSSGQFTTLSSVLYNTQPAGNRTYNFALARVRYLGPFSMGDGTAAMNMGKAKMFFRVCRTQVGSVAYDGAFARDPAASTENEWVFRDPAGNPTTSIATQSNGAYAWQQIDAPLEDVRGNGSILLKRRLPKPGFTGSPLVISSIPCFGDARADVAANGIDSVNSKSVPAAAPGVEQHLFFGALIDLNDSTALFPTVVNGPPVTPFPNLIINMHCCLLVELDLSIDVSQNRFMHPVLNGNTPANHDSLGMRNLTIV